MAIKIIHPTDEICIKLQEFYSFLLKDPTEAQKILDAVREDKPTEFGILRPFLCSPSILTKKDFPSYFLIDDYSLQYATPTRYGTHRAEQIYRLYGKKAVADISCGVGAQLLALAKKTKAAGIEKDPTRYWLCKINLEIAKLKGDIEILPEVFLGDALAKSTQAKLKKYPLLLCDSFRDDAGYSPALEELHTLYPEKQIIYEFRPRETIDGILKLHSWLTQGADVEFWGEGERCSRISVYVGKGNTVRFYQDDTVMRANLEYSLSDLAKAREESAHAISTEFPTQEFVMLNRTLVVNHFVFLLEKPVVVLDKRRSVCEIPFSISPKKRMVPLFSSSEPAEVARFIRHKEYALTLRFEIPSDQYWAFFRDYRFNPERKGSHRYSLFFYGGKYHLAEERGR